MTLDILHTQDPQVASTIDEELFRERNSIELIASENFTSLAVMEAVGSVFTNKYAEGYPGHRYYGGCEPADKAETLAIDRACELFGAKHANVQPHSGSQANQVAYEALIKPGDAIMGMSLAHGGHLSHGAKVNISGQIYQVTSYGVDPATECLDYDAIEEMAKAVQPKLIVAGASAYPRAIDFERFAAIAHGVGAYLMVDMAHIAGLVAGGCHQSPVPFADITTSTSHKTMRGPRGGFILTNDDAIAKKIDSALFPGIQGGPLMHVVAGKAVCFGEALKPEFKAYAEQIVKNSAALGRGMMEGGLRLVSGGTDNHLCLVDLTPADITGKDAQSLLESVGITCNKNAIPNETRPASIASGVRIGSAAMTTRGFNEDEALLIGRLIAKAVMDKDASGTLAMVADTVKQLLEAHPLYPELG